MEKTSRLYLCSKLSVPGSNPSLSSLSFISQDLGDVSSPVWFSGSLDHEASYLDFPFVLQFHKPKNLLLIPLSSQTNAILLLLS